MIEILKEKHEGQPERAEIYVTVKFTKHHEIFQNVETIRTYRIPAHKSQQEFVQEEYNNWIKALEQEEEF